MSEDLAASIDIKILAEKFGIGIFFIVVESVWVFGPGVDLQIDAALDDSYKGGFITSLGGGLMNLFLGSISDYILFTISD